MVEKLSTSYQSFIEFTQEFSQDNDRAAVILGAARLDDELRHLLEAVLVPNTTSSDDLLDSDGPLGSFSARIHMCYRLGLVDADMARALHLVRKIRNSFAHEVSGSSLDSGSYRDRVRALARPFLRLPGFVEFRDRYVASDSSAASRDFRSVVAILSLRLDAVDVYIEPIDYQHTITAVPPGWEDAATEVEVTATEPGEA